MGGKSEKNKLPPFVALLWGLLNSKAYIELPPSAGKILVYFLGKPRLTPRDPRYHSTTFVFPYSEAKRYGFAKKTYSDIIKDLVRLGFIDPVVKGGLRSGGKSMSVFKLSERWKKYGRADFKEVAWEGFGEHQIRDQVQNPHCIGAENEPKKGH